MIITIDTTKDSHSEISRAIQMLQALVGEKVVTNEQPANIFEDSSSMGGGLFSMFDSSQPSSPSDHPVEPPVEPSFAEEDKPSVQFY